MRSPRFEKFSSSDSHVCKHLSEIMSVYVSHVRCWGWIRLQILNIEKGLFLCSNMTHVGDYTILLLFRKILNPLWPSIRPPLILIYWGPNGSEFSNIVGGICFKYSSWWNSISIMVFIFATCGKYQIQVFVMPLYLGL